MHDACSIDCEECAMPLLTFTGVLLLEENIFASNQRKLSQARSRLLYANAGFITIIIVVVFEMVEYHERFLLVDRYSASDVHI